MIDIGTTHRLRVTRETESGWYLAADDQAADYHDAKEQDEVLLPAKHAPEGLDEGDELDVFVYLDSEDRPIATTQIPKAEVGEFACLEVKANTPVGAFLDWGLDKDVLVPFGEQHGPLNVGESYNVFLYLDNRGRITATSKIDEVKFEEQPHDFEPEQPVELIIGKRTELGFKAIVDQCQWGLLYENEVDEPLQFGQMIGGYIKHVREDGKIDLSLKNRREIRDAATEAVIDYLREHDGFAPVHDKSSPDEIDDLLGMSKKQFKKAIGGLYKQRTITIDDDGIRFAGNRGG